MTYKFCDYFHDRNLDIRTDKNYPTHIETAVTKNAEFSINDTRGSLNQTISYETN